LRERRLLLPFVAFGAEAPTIHSFFGRTDQRAPQRHSSSTCCCPFMGATWVRIRAARRIAGFPGAGRTVRRQRRRRRQKAGLLYVQEKLINLRVPATANGMIDFVVTYNGSAALRFRSLCAVARKHQAGRTRVREHADLGSRSACPSRSLTLSAIRSRSGLRFRRASV